MTYTIAVTHHAGGTAKTTTTLNIAYYLALAGKRVRIVDLDPQSDMSERLGVSPQAPSLTDALMNRGTSPQPVTLDWRGVKVHMLPASLEMADAERRLAGEPAREQRLMKALKPTAHHYDFTLIDSPPSLSVLTVNALYAADSVLIPVQAQDKAYRALAHVTDTIEDTAYWRGDGKLPILGILVTMVDNTSMSREIVESLQNSGKYGRYVFRTTIPLRADARYDHRNHAPIAVYKPTNDVAKAYQAVSVEVLERTHLFVEVPA